MKNHYLKLCLVTHLTHQSIESYKNFLLQAVAGGITSIQLRLKNQNVDEFSREIKALIDPFNIPLIINDHVELAKEIDAFGVHLGQSDMSPDEARKLLGPQKIIGWSIETIEQLHEANELSSINYVAASAVFSSKTKTDCKTIWGIEGLKNIVTLSKHPVVAIGGIHSHNADQVIATGVEGMAVVSDIHDAMDPKRAAEKLLSVYRGKNYAV
jgi:thiamine-phosphate pyrophosphorylase